LVSEDVVIRGCGGKCQLVSELAFSYPRRAEGEIGTDVFVTLPDFYLGKFSQPIVICNSLANITQQSHSI
jgi:hypothetical protein